MKFECDSCHAQYMIAENYCYFRENLIVAFEYLSVLSCGYGAKNWNHITIANELRRVVPEADPIADELGELYALARYTPAEQTLPPHVIPDARQFLCELAGVRA